MRDNTQLTRDGRYQIYPEQAHKLAQNRKKERNRTRIPESTWARVEQFLREDWSPEQISGWLAREASGPPRPGQAPAARHGNRCTSR